LNQKGETVYYEEKPRVSFTVVSLTGILMVIVLILTVFPDKFFTLFIFSLLFALNFSRMMDVWGGKYIVGEQAFIFRKKKKVIVEIPYAQIDEFSEVAGPKEVKALRGYKIKRLLILSYDPKWVIKYTDDNGDKRCLLFQPSKELQRVLAAKIKKKGH